MGKKLRYNLIDNKNVIHNMDQKKFLDLSGKYSSHGVDCHDGYFEKEVNFKLDAKNSDFEKGYITYEYYSNLH